MANPDVHLPQTIDSLIAAQSQAQEPRNLSPYVMTLSELARSEIPPREFLIGEWCPKESIGMVFAKRGVGKSWFCMCLALAITEGHDQFLGWPLKEHGHVLYVDGEMALSDLKTRFSLLSIDYRDNKNLLILPAEKLFRESVPISLDEVTEQRAISQMLDNLEKEDRRPKLLILDNLSSLRRSVNENDNSEMEALMMWMNELRHLGYAVLVVHHANKQGEQRGASKTEDIMDFVIRLEEPSTGIKEGRFDLTFSKVRARRPTNDEISCALQKNLAGRLELSYRAGSASVHPEMMTLRIIAEQPSNKPTKQATVCRIANVTSSTVSRHVKSLKEQELLHQGDILEPTRYGFLALHEVWPDDFLCPEGLKMGDRPESPF